MADADSEGRLDGSSPLRPDASIEEIQARIAHLSSTESAEQPDYAEAPKGTAATAGAGAREGAAATSATGQSDFASAAPVPPIASPLDGPTNDSAPSAELAPGTEKPRRGGIRTVVGGGTAVLVAVVALAAKFGLKLAVVGVAAAALSGAFGNRYGRLPSDQRDAFEQRYQQIIGSSLDGLSDSERATRLDDLVNKGAARLDDPSLVLWAQIDARAHAATDTATCAQIARGWFGKGSDRATLSAAVGKAYDSLPDDDFGHIIDLDLKAMAAETNGSPAVRSVSDATMEPVFAALDGSLSSADGSTLDALVGDSTVTDAEACSALRDLEKAAAQLTPAQFASWAVWISTP